MRNLKRRALVAGLIVAFAIGAGVWRAFVRAGTADRPSAAPLRSARSAASASPGAAGLKERGSRAAERGEIQLTDEEDAGARAIGAESDRDRGRGAAAGSSSKSRGRAIYLRADAPPDGILSSPVRGLDTGAPRALVLWRVEDGRRIRVADGWSEPDGSLHFPEILVPDSSVQLVLTAAEEGPAGLDRSASDEVRLGGLRAPQVRTTRDADGNPGLRVTASHSLGAVVVADADGLEIARAELPRVPFPGRRLIVVPLAEGATGTFLVSQELPDGSRSEWQPIDVVADAP